MLVAPDKRPIDDHVFKVGITSHRLEHLLEYAFQRPPSEEPPSRVPVAKGIGQISPR
jgi:hypothetical protein